MKLSEYIFVTSRPYSSFLREVSISGKLFTSRQLAFNMEMQTRSNWCWTATSTSVSHFYWFGAHGRNAASQTASLAKAIAVIVRLWACPNPLSLQDALGVLREAVRPLANMDETMGG